ncbi:hypothetical protein [Kandleria vitulina]|nr:hypothetical protein [Kandleria vitulina]
MSLKISMIALSLTTMEKFFTSPLPSPITLMGSMNFRLNDS